MGCGRQAPPDGEATTSPDHAGSVGSPNGRARSRVAAGRPRTSTSAVGSVEAAAATQSLGIGPRGRPHRAPPMSARIANAPDEDAPALAHCEPETGPQRVRCGRTGSSERAPVPATILDVGDSSTRSFRHHRRHGRRRVEVSLTERLRHTDGPLRRWFDTTFPHLRAAVPKCARWRQPLGAPPACEHSWRGVVGMAVDYRLRWYWPAVPADTLVAAMAGRLLGRTEDAWLHHVDQVTGAHTSTIARRPTRRSRRRRHPSRWGRTLRP